MPPDSLGIDYHSPETKSILSRSYSRWQAALRLAKSTPGFPESSFKLEGLLSRVPSLPDDIPSESTWMEGYSTWTNSDLSCPLASKTEKTRRFNLRIQHPVMCTISPSHNFRVWEGKANNGIALLILGWAYILSASLAERQRLCLRYASSLDSLDGPSGSVEINLDYASTQELKWWKAIAARGTGWTIPGDRPAPWTVRVGNLDVNIVGDIGDIDVIHAPPPTASQAASYLERLCIAFDLGSQCSAALAAALSLPLHRSTAPLKSATIELPRPSLLTRVVSPDQGQCPTDFKLLRYYITLSLVPNYFGSALWSIFWEPDVPCNSAGAWLGPIGDVLRPILQDNNLELLAKVLSFTNVAPLWLGISLCGRGAIINSIMPFLDRLLSYPHSQPSLDVAAWTSIPQSFMDIQTPGPYFQDGRVSRANIWRLRHDCHLNYADDSFSTTPLYGWPPFGTMRVKDVELELLDHLNCSHQWEYSHWTWFPGAIRDIGFSDNRGLFPHWSQPPLGVEIQACENQKSKVNYTASRVATEKVFWWCCSQVEKGFGGSLVPFFTSDSTSQLYSSASNHPIDRDAIRKWIGNTR